MAGSGRPATDDEIRQLREHVASAGFDPDAWERVRGRGAGIAWRGRTLRESDRLPPVEAHYVRHVLAEREWPTGTTLTDYLRSIIQVIEDNASGVFVSRYQGMLQIGFAGRSGHWRGPRGRRWILIEFRQITDHLTTAYQIESLDEVASQSQRSEFRWLMNPREPNS